MTTEIGQPDAFPVEAEQLAPPATLLFVDDEPNILSSLRRLFRPLGYRMLTAENGEQGLNILAGEPIDVFPAGLLQRSDGHPLAIYVQTRGRL